MFNLVLVSCLVVGTLSLNVNFKNCEDPSGTAHVKTVSIEPCEAEPCILHKGGNTTIKISFTTTAEHAKVKSVVHGHIGVAWLPFPIDHAEVCDDQACGLTCPLPAAEDLTYTYTLAVSALYPSIEVAVKWELVDEDKGDIVCVMMDAELA